MPLYRYACPCGHRAEEYRTIAQRRKGPIHCDKRMKIVILPTMVAVFTPYDAIAGDRRHIPNSAEHKAFLREFNYEEVGNDPAYAPPNRTPEEQAYLDTRERADLQRSHDEQAAILKDLHVGE